MKIHPIICLVLIAALLTIPAWASCGTWIIRGNTEYHYDAEYENAVKSSTGHAAALKSGSTSKEEANDQADVNASQMDAASNETAKAPKEDPLPTETVINEQEIKEPVVDLKGDWKVILNTVIDGQNTQEALDLILIQTNDRLQGYGNVLKKGTDIPVTATGHIASNDSISLNVKQVEQDRDYRLDLAIIEERMEGSYKIYQDGSLAGSGNITASKSGL